MKKNLWYALLCFASITSVGCSSLSGGNDISVRESTRVNPNAPKTKYVASIRIAGYTDDRKPADLRRIGTAENKVSGMDGSDIRLDHDVTQVVADSIHKRLDDTGIQMLEHDDKNALFELSGAIKQLSYDVKERDYVAITLETTLKDVATGKVIWSGVVTEKNDRFAGVSGNSKSDIADYLRKELGVVTGKTSEAITATLMASRPELFNITPGTKAIPGVTVYVAPGASPAPVVAPAVMPTPVSATNDKPLQAATNGMLLVSTDPARAKVYLDGVYYGMSPLQIEAAPGVHTVEAKLKGYKNSSEKVAVRKGDKTELELSLEK